MLDFSIQQFFDAPPTVRDFRIHRWRHAQRPMNLAEIVIGEVQAVRGPQVLPLFAEAIHESRQPAHLHSDREVLAFHDAGADTVGIRISENRDHLRFHHFSGAVAAFAVCRLLVDFDELREAHAVLKRVADRRNVEAETIGRDLEMPVCRRVT